MLRLSVVGVALALVGAAQAFLAPSSSTAALARRHPRPAHPDARTRGDALMAAGESALIIQNKGGGHGEIGYHLAKQLTQKGLKVTILNDKYSETKEPFKSYDGLRKEGVEIVAAELASADVKSLLGGQSFHYVFDNFAKNVELARPVAGLAKAQQWPVKSYVFVSSGGMYKAGDQFPLVEEDAVSDSNDARQIEVFLQGTGLPYTCFRPQYIYGPLTNKRDYLDWFFDRIVRDRPLPLPSHGDQLTTLTHVEDVASLLASVVDQPNAQDQIFNCATDRYVTFKEVVRLAAQAAGKPEAAERVVLYDPAAKKADTPKGWWPFRATHFNVSPDKAKRLLGWKPQHDLAQDLQAYYRDYMAQGLDKRELSFEVDDKVLA